MPVGVLLAKNTNTANQIVEVLGSIFSIFPLFAVQWGLGGIMKLSTKDHTVTEKSFEDTEDGSVRLKNHQEVFWSQTFDPTFQIMVSWYWMIAVGVLCSYFVWRHTMGKEDESPTLKQEAREALIESGVEEKFP